MWNDKKIRVFSILSNYDGTAVGFRLNKAYNRFFDVGHVWAVTGGLPVFHSVLGQYNYPDFF